MRESSSTETTQKHKKRRVANDTLVLGEEEMGKAPRQLASVATLLERRLAPRGADGQSQISTGRTLRG